MDTSCNYNKRKKIMKKKVTIGLIIILILLIVLYLAGMQKINNNTDKLRSAITNISEKDGEVVSLNEIIPFEWSDLYIFEPYTDLSDIKERANISSIYLLGHYNESPTLIISNKGSLAAMDDESSKYFRIELSDSDDISSHINASSELPFKVSLENGVVILKETTQPDLS